MSSSSKAPPHVVWSSFGALMCILGFTGTFVVKLLELGYDLPSAFCAAAAAGVVAGEIAYRLLGNESFRFRPGGGRPPAIP